MSANLAGVSDIFSTEESGYEPGPCRGLLDSGTDEEFIACVTTSLDALYVQEFLTLWNVTNEQMLATPVRHVAAGPTWGLTQRRAGSRHSCGGDMPSPTAAYNSAWCPMTSSSRSCVASPFWTPIPPCA